MEVISYFRLFLKNIQHGTFFFPKTSVVDYDENFNQRKCLLKIRNSMGNFSHNLVNLHLDASMISFS